MTPRTPRFCCCCCCREYRYVFRHDTSPPHSVHDFSHSSCHTGRDGGVGGTVHRGQRGWSAQTVVRSLGMFQENVAPSFVSTASPFHQASCGEVFFTQLARNSREARRSKIAGGVAGANALDCRPQEYVYDIVLAPDGAHRASNKM